MAKYRPLGMPSLMAQCNVDLAVFTATLFGALQPTIQALTISLLLMQFLVLVEFVVMQCSMYGTATLLTELS